MLPLLPSKPTRKATYEKGLYRANHSLSRGIVGNTQKRNARRHVADRDVVSPCIAGVQISADLRTVGRCRGPIIRGLHSTQDLPNLIRA
jgi:hypothetical protein